MLILLDVGQTDRRSAGTHPCDWKDGAEGQKRTWKNLVFLTAAVAAAWPCPRGGGASSPVGCTGRGDGGDGGLKPTLLGGVGLALLVDEVGVDGLHVGFAEQIVEALHAGGAEHAFQNDGVEGGVQCGCEFA